MLQYVKIKEVYLMRCKNCGSENEEGRYICQNCGSPLYDEDEEMLMNDDGYLDDDDYDE